MHKQFYALKFFFISLLLSMGTAVTCTAQTVQINTYNITTGGSGTEASAGDYVLYAITTTNNTSSNLSSSVIYANIPAGTSYIPAGTYPYVPATMVNGVAVPDIDGKMPFASGGLINSSSASPGVLAPNTSVVIQYAVHVNTDAGGIKNYATLRAINSSGTPVVVKSDVTTIDAHDFPFTCPNVYVMTPQVATGLPPTYNYRYLRALNTTNGTSLNIVFAGLTKPLYDALTGALISTSNSIRYSVAIGYDASSNRVYFVNNAGSTAEDLCYVDLNSPSAAYRYTGYPLETNTNTGYNIDRMTFSPDGYNYALTANGQDLIQFSIDPGTNTPVINRLGSLINDPANGTNDVLSETSGDIFPDQAAMLYLIPNSGKMYRINPVTRIATYVGTISNAPAAGINSVASDAAGNIYLGGAYQAVYRVNAATMNAVPISSGTTGVYTSGDYASCISPLLAPAINITKTYSNLTGASTVRAGDPIEYTITISNTGNLSATAVILSDALPANSHYIANSTTVNGVAVADNAGTMPFAVISGALINSAGETAGIVKPSDVITIKFRVTTDEYKTICNQSVLTYSDGSGNTIYVFSDDPSQSGTTDATCFYSDKSLVSLQANKTYLDLDRNQNVVGVVAYDHIEYTIEVTNTGTADANGVTFYDAIPVHAQYVANSTTINGVAVPDISGAMPYSVTGGALINSPGASTGVVNPGTTNKAVIKFRVVSTGIDVNVCNQASVSWTIASGNNIIYSDDPSQSGSQDQTCFFSGGAFCPECGRIATNNSPANNNSDLQTFAKVQPNPFNKDLNVQVQLNTAEQIRVRLIDFYGRTVYTTTQKLAAGNNSLHLDIPATLASGIYVLELSAGNNRLVQKKLIKQ